MQITNEDIEAACKAHAPQWNNIDPEIQAYGRYQMKAAIEAALANSDVMRRFCRFVDKIENRAMACDGPVTPFIDEVFHGCSDIEKKDFQDILGLIYATPL